MSRYGVKDVFNTLQGEGLRAGCRSVFVRFTGCNLWSGQAHRRDDGDGACARWCDTDFFKGTVMTTEQLLAAMEREWPESEGDTDRWCVLTGGEPMLQVNGELVDALHAAGWLIAVETNGTIENPAFAKLDHVCVAPKLARDGLTPLPLTPELVPDEVKVVLPGAVEGQPGWNPARLLELQERFGAGAALFVQPMDPLVDTSLISETALKRSPDVTVTRSEDAALSAKYSDSVSQCIGWVLANPRWRLGTQAHKTWGLP